MSVILFCFVFEHNMRKSDFSIWTQAIIVMEADPECRELCLCFLCQNWPGELWYEWGADNAAADLVDGLDL